MEVFLYENFFNIYCRNAIAFGIYNTAFIFLFRQGDKKNFFKRDIRLFNPFGYKLNIKIDRSLHTDKLV